LASRQERVPPPLNQALGDEMGAALTWLQTQRTMWPPLRIGAGLIGLPTVLVAIACVRGLNLLMFSGHGGPGWLMLPLCFPILLVNVYRLVIRPLRRTGISPWRRSAAISIAYLVLAYPFAVLAEHRITKDLGLPIADRAFYRLMTFPIGPVLPLWRTTR
jgi:hypothetical protein